MRERQPIRGRWWSRATMVAVVLAQVTSGSFSLAQEQDQDLPGRVARLAEFAGQVLVSSQERPDEWEPVGINYPITSGINVWVSSEGRAEIDYGGGQVRLAGDTNVHVARLDDRELTLFVAQGRVIVRVRAQDPGDVTHIDTPNAHVELLRPGLYRVDVAPDRQATALIVREGEANAALASETRQVLAGQAISVTGSDQAIFEVRYAQRADGFDTWSADRDRGYEGLRTSAYVSRQMVGAADLDRYGAWQTTREYGPVWFPYVAAPGWAPYSDGYWIEMSGWGPTWVDSAPWGYAPFHYGRWAFIGGRWGWCPGGYVARPVWAPALVAWYGGPGWGLGVSGGRGLYGWVPLGWREPYYPGWPRCSANCWAKFNRPYGVTATERASGPAARHVNLAVPGALSAVPASSLRGRAPVRSNLVSVPGELASSATAMRTAPPMRIEQRETPRAPSTTSTTVSFPAAASTYARPPRGQPPTAAVPRSGAPAVSSTASSAAVPSASAPGVRGTLPPLTPAQREAARTPPSQPARVPASVAPAYAPRASTGAAPSPMSPAPVDIPPQRSHGARAPSPGLAPPPAVSPPAGVVPRVVPAAPAAIAPSQPASQPAAPPSGNAAPVRGVVRSVPEPPSADPRR